MENEQEENRISDDFKEVMDATPSWVFRWGIIILGLFLLCSVLLSISIRYPDVITAQVNVTSVPPPQEARAKTSGYIREVLVTDNATVKKDQVLAVLESRANYKDILALGAFLKKHPIRNKKDLDVYEEIINKNYKLGAVLDDYVNFKRVYVSYRTHLLYVKDYDPSGSIENQLNEQLEAIHSVEEQHALLEEELLLMEADYKRSKKLFEQGFISNAEWEKKEIERNQLRRNLEQVSLSLNETRKTYKSLQERLLQVGYDKSNNGLSLYQELSNSYQLLLQEISDWKEKYLLQSHMDGKVTFLSYWHKNQYVDIDDAVFVVVPTHYEKIIGRVEAPLRNSGKLKAGQKVYVKLDNYPFYEHGSLIAKTENISLVPSNNKYLVTLGFENLVTTTKESIPYKQNLSGTCEIVTEDISLLERILYTFYQLFKY